MLRFHRRFFLISLCLVLLLLGGASRVQAKELQELPGYSSRKTLRQDYARIYQDQAERFMREDGWQFYASNVPMMNALKDLSPKEQHFLLVGDRLAPEDYAFENWPMDPQIDLVPRAILARRKDLLLVEEAQPSLLRLSYEGDVLEVKDLGLKRPAAMALGPEGKVYLVDEGLESLLVLNQDLVLQERLRLPKAGRYHSLAVAEDGCLYLAKEDAVFPAPGLFCYQEGHWKPMGAFVGPLLQVEGQVYAANLRHPMAYHPQRKAVAESMLYSYLYRLEQGEMLIQDSFPNYFAPAALAYEDGQLFAYSSSLQRVYAFAFDGQQLRLIKGVTDRLEASSLAVKKTQLLIGQRSTGQLQVYDLEEQKPSQWLYQRAEMDGEETSHSKEEKTLLEILGLGPFQPWTLQAFEAPPSRPSALPSSGGARPEILIESLLLWRSKNDLALQLYRSKRMQHPQGRGEEAREEGAMSPAWQAFGRALFEGESPFPGFVLQEKAPAELRRLFPNEAVFHISDPPNIFFFTADWEALHKKKGAALVDVHQKLAVAVPRDDALLWQKDVEAPTVLWVREKNVYGYDAAKGTVWRTRMDGQGSFEETPWTFMDLRAVAEDPRTGSLYFLDQGRKQILRLNERGALEVHVDLPKGPEAGFHSLALDAKGRIYLAAQGTIFPEKGLYMWEDAGPWQALGYFSGTLLAIDGAVYAANLKHPLAFERQLLQRHEGTYLNLWYRLQGTQILPIDAFPAFFAPTALAYDAGVVYAYSAGLNRVYAFAFTEEGLALLGAVSDRQAREHQEGFAQAFFVAAAEGQVFLSSLREKKLLAYTQKLPPSKEASTTAEFYPGGLLGSLYAFRPFVQIEAEGPGQVYERRMLSPFAGGHPWVIRLILHP